MKQKGFASRRVHSLLGVLPLGVFLFEHLIVNHFATGGADQFNAAGEVMQNLPFRYALELGIIFIPLFFHAVYGVYIALTSKNNASKYSYFRNWMFLLQRITGIITFVFIVWHLWGTRIAAMFGTHPNAQMVVDILDNPLAIIFFVIGTLSVAFHFANGLFTFLITWGLIVSPKSQKAANYFCSGVFLVLAYISIRTIVAFATMG